MKRPVVVAFALWTACAPPAPVDVDDAGDSVDAGARDTADDDDDRDGGGTTIDDDAGDDGAGDDDAGDIQGDGGAVDGGAGDVDAGAGDAGAVVDAGDAPADAGDAGGPGDVDAGAVDADAGDAGALDAGDVDAGAVGLADVGTLVVLGDSIGDMSQVPNAQTPFYYELLGPSLAAFYGHDVDVVNAAVSGATTAGLDDQIATLPDAMTPPVVVVVTAGGNDFLQALFAVYQGTDADERAAAAANIAAALALLPDDALVFEGNIYDASDRARQTTTGCDVDATVPLAESKIDAWNDAIAASVVGAGGTPVDLRDGFDGHGIDSGDSWFLTDCIHPNAAGHAALHDLFYAAITGAPAP